MLYIIGPLALHIIGFFANRKICLYLNLIAKDPPATPCAPTPLPPCPPPPYSPAPYSRYIYIYIYYSISKGDLSIHRRTPNQGPITTKQKKQTGASSILRLLSPIVTGWQRPGSDRCGGPHARSHPPYPLPGGYSNSQAVPAIPSRRRGYDSSYMVSVPLVWDLL